MKLIQWVEVYIGRRKTKKGRDAEKNVSPVKHNHPDATRKNALDPTDEIVKLTPGDIPSEEKSSYPGRVSADSGPCSRKALNIRTSFLEPSTVGDVAVSPRQRSRIRTNPWLPSPRSSCIGSFDSGLSGTPKSSCSSQSSDVGSSGTVFESKGKLSDLPSGKNSKCAHLKQSNLAPRSIKSLERDVAKPAPSHFQFTSDTRSLPPEEWIETPSRPESDCESDEAYCDDFSDQIQTEISNCSTFKSSVQTETDSACVTDASCTTTPSSETVRESLEEKVTRLRSERIVVQRKMREAREEELICREERLYLQTELVKYRRVLLLHTLHQLRDQLERQEERVKTAYSATWELRQEWTLRKF